MNKNSFIGSPQIHVIPLFFLIFLSIRYWVKVLKDNLVLRQILRGKCPVFHYWVLFSYEDVPLHFLLVYSFYYECVLNFVKFFPTSITIWLFPLVCSFLRLYFLIFKLWTRLVKLESIAFYLCIIFIYFWIWHADILLRLFVSIFMRNICLIFLSCSMFYFLVIRFSLSLCFLKIDPEIVEFRSFFFLYVFSVVIFSAAISLHPTNLGT